MDTRLDTIPMFPFPELKRRSAVSTPVSNGPVKPTRPSPENWRLLKIIKIGERSWPAFLPEACHLSCAIVFGDLRLDSLIVSADGRPDWRSGAAVSRAPPHSQAMSRLRRQGKACPKCRSSQFGKHWNRR